ncbi:hypothetical protein Emag_002773 [Eimeria magna]
MSLAVAASQAGAPHSRWPWGPLALVAKRHYYLSGAHVTEQRVYVDGSALMIQEGSPAAARTDAHTPSGAAAAPAAAATTAATAGTAASASEGEGAYIASMTPFALTRSILKAASLVCMRLPLLQRDGQRDVRLWQAFGDRGAAVAAAVPPEDLARMLSAFGAQGLRHKGFLAAAAAALLPQLQQLSPSGVCRVTQAYGQLLCVHPALQQQLQREVARKASAMTVNQIAYAFGSLCRLGAPPGPLVRVLRRELVVRHAQLSPGGVVVALHAAAALKFRDTKLLAALAAALCRAVGALDPKGLALAANSLHRLHMQNAFIFQLLAAAAQRMLQQQQQQQQQHRMQPRDLAMLLHATVNAGAAPPAFVKEAAAAAGRRMQTYDLQAICLLAAALTKHYRQQQQQQQQQQHEQQDGERLTQEELFKVLERAGERVGQLASQLTPPAVCCLVDAFASVRFRYGPLLFHAPRHVACCFDAATATETEATAAAEATTTAATAAAEATTTAATAAAGATTTAVAATTAAAAGDEPRDANTPNMGDRLEVYTACQVALLLRAFRRMGISGSSLLPYAFKALPPLQQQQQQPQQQQQQQQSLRGGFEDLRETQGFKGQQQQHQHQQDSTANSAEALAGDRIELASNTAAAAAATAADEGGSVAAGRQQPLLHSLLWILQSAASDSFVDRGGLSQLYGHLALRAEELPPHAFVIIWECASRLGVCTAQLQHALQQQMLVSPSLEQRLLLLKTFSSGSRGKSNSSSNSSSSSNSNSSNSNSSSNSSSSSNNSSNSSSGSSSRCCFIAWSLLGDLLFSQLQLQRMHDALLDLGLSALSFGVACVPQELLSDVDRQQQQQDTSLVYVHLTLKQQKRLREEGGELLRAAALNEASQQSLRACDFKGDTCGVERDRLPQSS